MSAILGITMLLLGGLIGVIIYNSIGSSKTVVDDKKLIVAEIGIKLKEIINEHNFFDVHRGLRHVDENVTYTVKYDGEHYYATINDDEAYKFIKVRNEMIYLGQIPFESVLVGIIEYGSDTFFYEFEYEPIYDATAGFSYDSEFNYMFFAESLKQDIDVCFETTNINSYTLYVKNHFTWDKSRYDSSEGIKIGVLVKYDNGEILDTFASQKSDGWKLSFPAFKTKFSEYPEFEYIFNRYVATALFVTARIRAESNRDKSDPKLTGMVRLSDLK